MEKFMFIFHGGQMDTMTPDEMQAHMSKWMTWVHELRAQNRYVGGDPLLPGGKLVVGKKGKSVTDGPYTEGKEVVGGYLVIRASNFDEAVAISKDCPELDIDGTIQVRQVMPMEM